MSPRSRTLALLLLLFVFIIASVPYVHAAGPDFQVSATPSTFNVARGYSNSTSIRLTSINNFVGTVTLSVSLPTGFSASWNPGNVITPTANSTVPTTLRLFVSSTAYTGLRFITVTATNGTTYRYVYLWVTVLAAPPFDLGVSVSPGTLNMVPGQSHDTTVTVTSVSGFNGTVQLTASSSPSGLTLTFSPVNITVTPTSPGVSTLTIAIPSSVPNGAYSVTIYATNSSITRSGSVIINAPAPASPLFTFVTQFALYLMIAVGIIAVAAAFVKHGRKPQNSL